MRYSFTLLPILFLAMSLHAENWMKRLPDDTYVAMLSIPGSHDTGTGNGFPGITTSIYGPFGDSYARAQDKSFQEQWDMGVRAFDMRPAVNGSYLNDNHGIMPTKLRFDDALYFLRDKLTENPSEFAIIHVLHASAGDKNASNYGQKLVDAIIAIDAAKHHGELSFLYVKVSIQSKGIGLGIWKAIEALHPEIEVWENCTPYFDRRNIHFYINRLGFHAVEFFNEHHPDPHMPEQFDQEDGLFKFEKCV